MLIKWCVTYTEFLQTNELLVKTLKYESQKKGGSPNCLTPPFLMGVECLGEGSWGSDNYGHL